MIVLVTGSRDWTDGGPVYRTLDRAKETYGDELFVIAGGARGADRHAENWAKARHVAHHIEPAKWKVHSQGCQCRGYDYCRRAGCVRNQKMLDQVLEWMESGNQAKTLAFKDGFDLRMLSGGTEDMCRRSILAGVPVFLYDQGRWARIPRET